MGPYIIRYYNGEKNPREQGIAVARMPFGNTPSWLTSRGCDLVDHFEVPKGLIIDDPKIHYQLEAITEVAFESYLELDLFPELKLKKKRALVVVY